MNGNNNFAFYENDVASVRSVLDFSCTHVDALASRVPEHISRVAHLIGRLQTRLGLPSTANITEPETPSTRRVTLQMLPRVASEFANVQTAFGTLRDTGLKELSERLSELVKASERYGAFLSQMGGKMSESEYRGLPAFNRVVEHMPTVVGSFKGWRKAYESSVEVWNEEENKASAQRGQSAEKTPIDRAGRE